MATISFDTSDQRLRAQLERILLMLQRNPSVEIRQDGEHYEVTMEDESNNAHEWPGTPMTWEELRAEIREAEEDIKAGRVVTSEQLLDDFNKWKNI